MLPTAPRSTALILCHFVATDYFTYLLCETQARQAMISAGLLLRLQLAAAALSAGPGTTPGRWVQDEFAISFFVQSGPPPGDPAAFQLVKDGNFTVVGLYDHLHKGDAANATEQLRLCEQFGIKCIVALDGYKAKARDRVISHLLGHLELCPRASAHCTVRCTPAVCPSCPPHPCRVLTGAFGTIAGRRAGTLAAAALGNQLGLLLGGRAKRPLLRRPRRRGGGGPQGRARRHVVHQPAAVQHLGRGPRQQCLGLGPRVGRPELHGVRAA